MLTYGNLCWVFVDTLAVAQQQLKICMLSQGAQSFQLILCRISQPFMKVWLMLVQGDETAIAGMLHGDGRVLANALDENRRRSVHLCG